MSQSFNILAEPLRSLGESSISSSYAPLGTALANPSQIYMVNNLTNAVLTFSLDGINDHFVVNTSTSIIIDIGSDKGLYNSLSLRQGTQLYVKGSPSSGTVYLSSFYMG